MITLHAPTGISQGSTVILRDGSTTTVDASGNVSVDATNALPLIAGGWQMTGSSFSATAGILFSQIAKMLSDRVLGKAGLVMGSTNTRLANIAVGFQIGAAAAGVNTYKAAAAVAAGTALPAGTVPADQWAIYLLSVNASDTKAITPGAANFTTGYASEAAAIAALPATPAASAALGYMTLKTATGQPFVDATDALATGTGGNPASVTNYYDAGLAY
jgi:hypothetical protein